MPSRRIQTGPTGDTVRERIAAIRKGQGFSMAELARRLADAGRPFGLTTLSEIESGRRRVDVDDLMVFAVALDVSPITLLMPDTARADAPVTFTGAPRKMPAEKVRGWLGARNSLGDSDPASNTEDLWLIRSNPQWVPLVGDLRPDLMTDIDPQAVAAVELLLARAMAQREQGSTDGHR